MQFFRPPERRPVPEQPALPEWLGPPQYEVGVLVPVQGAVVARSDAMAVALRGIVAMLGGGGGGAVWDFDGWSWPLPPPEPFDLVCEWPGVGIPLTRHAVHGAAIRTAAADSRPIWEPD
jgi:hypothetical protein